MKNMRKIIIEFEEHLNAFEVLDMVKKVIAGERVSETSNGVKHYCWHTIFPDRKTVSVRRKRKPTAADSFIVLSGMTRAPMLFDNVPPKKKRKRK